MSVGEIAEFLRGRIGLDAAALGPTTLLRALKIRMAACECAEFGQYTARLRGCETELQALIEGIVVPETWFFRDRAALQALARLAREEKRAGAGGVLRLLSLPCATGEEPYSMAMALLDAGVPGERFQIRGVDISAEALGRACRGIYGKNSFRGDDLRFRDRYFESLAGGYRVKPEVRAPVDFVCANIFADDLAPAESFDAVFCRNMLIYFDPASQARAVLVLRRLLRPGGMLFLGPSETGLAAGQGLVSARIPHAFAFRKTEAAAADDRGDKKRPPAPARARAEIPAPGGALKSSVPEVPPGISAPGALAGARTPPAPDLDAVRRLADGGQLAEATRQCDAMIGRTGPSAEAFCLLGLLQDAQSRHFEALQSYRKAIYLDPESRDALFHLGLLLERRGANDEAERFRARLRRLEAGREG